MNLNTRIINVYSGNVCLLTMYRVEVFTKNSIEIYNCNRISHICYIMYGILMLSYTYLGNLYLV